MQKLIDLGFTSTGAMEHYPWQQVPCRHCPGETHSLFAAWAASSPSPKFWCQKQAQEVNYQWQRVERPSVSTMADVRALPRWIGTEGKRPSKYVDSGGRTGFFTFSHPNPTKCDGFEDPATSPESFTRFGGVCLNHRRTDGKTRTRYPSAGWGPYDSIRAMGFTDAQITYCTNYGDAPPLLVIDIDLPTEEAALETAKPIRDSLIAALAAMGCPTAPSSNPERRRAAVVVDDPDSYGGKKQVWEHPLGLAVEIYTPGAAAHCKTYGLDGPLPTISPSTLHRLLEEQGFKLPQSKTQGQGNSRDKQKIDYFAYGELFGARLAAGWAWDAYAGGYHRWEANHWHNLTNTDDTQDVLWEYVQHSTLDVETKTDIQNNRAEVLRGVKAALRRELPLVKGANLAVANGVVDLETGEMRPFDAARDTHRAVTGGAYRPEWTDGECMGVLMMRYTPAGVALLDVEGVETLLHFTALALSGRSQRHTPILYLWGASGSGKGGTLSLLKWALGGRALGTTLGALEEKSDRDPVWASILINDVLMVLVSESEAVQKESFLAKTGDNPMSKRKPYGTLVEGTPRCMFVIAGVDPPRFDLSAGFWRRTGVIKFPEHETDDPIPDGHKADPTQEQMDALITLAIRRARAVFGKEYKVTRGKPEDLEIFRREVDPLHSWLQERHQQGTLEGQTLKRLCEEFIDGEGRRSLPQRVMTNRLKSIGYLTTRGSWQDVIGKTANAQFVHHKDTLVDLHKDEWIHGERTAQRSSLFVPSVN